MKKLGITTDCVCDLPDDYLKLHDVGIVYFYITTDRGRFKDGYEITSGNIIEYLEDGGEKAATNAPEPEEYREFFQDRLKECDELIHISISSKVSLSCKNASSALKLMGEQADRVHVIDSKHLSTGMGHLVIKAVEMRDSGKAAEEICRELEQIKRLKSCAGLKRLLSQGHLQQFPVTAVRERLVSCLYMSEEDMCYEKYIGCG